MTNITQLLKSKQLKVTPQRLAIYTMICSTTKHPTAETIYKSLEEQYPTMSLATVYKTLDVLKSANLVQELNVGQGSSRYDACIDTHFHLICNQCDDVIDLKDVRSMKQIRREIAERIDFEVQSEQIYLFGICGECRKYESADVTKAL